MKNAYWDLAYARENLARAAAVAGPREAGARRQREARPDRHDGADRHRRGAVGSGAQRRGGDRRRSPTSSRRRIGCARSCSIRTTPDFWTRRSNRRDAMPFQPYAVDVEGAVRHALENRTDVKLAKNSIEQNEVNLKYYKGQTLPGGQRAASTTSRMPLGGTLLAPITSFPPAAPIAAVLSRTRFRNGAGRRVHQRVSRPGRSA